MPALYAINTRDDGTVLTATIYMADHQLHADNLSINMMGITYTDAGYDAVTDGQSGGSRSKPTHLQGQLERLTFAIKQIKVLLSPAITNWWETISSTTGISIADTTTNLAAASTNITAAQCTGRTTITNAGRAAAASTAALPPGAVNYVTHFNHVDSGDLIVDPNGTEALYVDGVSLGAGVALTSKKKGARYTCIWNSSGGWWEVNYYNTKVEVETVLAADISTMSVYPAYETATGLSVTVIAGASGKVRIDYSINISPPAATRVYLQLDRGGTKYKIGDVVDTTASFDKAIAGFRIFTGLTPGTSYTWQVEWCVGGGTATIYAGSAPERTMAILIATTK